MKKIINGKEVEVTILGGFEIEELGKRYIMCSYDDNKDSDKELVLIYEIDEDNNLLSIPSDEKEMVLDFYNALKEC